ncbi:prolyl oligopeptidase family serine peptidase [Massilibacteroides sp.]|uniref:alpha/beta hydrolase family protein n=1 Tax=Massilibacteroides sp. TaxID=2034766 RepID=UPI002628D93E|nr:prolyl oligopeptidase family serine peptidase [Massilibacteroides sp.]MDD4514529.1 prolyl oligopeptidase family serine peptidase [Massilibacteroides sp.]
MNSKMKSIIVLLFGALSLHAAEDIDVKVQQYKHAGPFTVNKPILADTVNVNGKPFEAKNLLKATLPTDIAFKQADILEADTAGKVTFTSPEKGYALHLFSFYLNSDRYVKGNLEISGSGDFEVFVDNKSVGKTAELKLEPRRYEVVVKYLTAETDTCAPYLKSEFKTKDTAVIVASLDPTKRYTLKAMTEGKNFSGVSVSSDGKLALVKYSTQLEGGKSEQFTQLIETATGKIKLQGNGFLNTARWMPKSNAMYYTRTGYDGTELIKVDAVTMQETVLASSLPEKNPYFAPDEQSLFFMVKEEGPKEGKELIRVQEPSDRLPGFRDRYFIWRYSLQTGLYEQLTYGFNSTYINDISQDSRYLLFGTSERVYTSLPHSRNSLYKLDLQTLAVDTLWEKAPYINQASFSPDGKQLLVSGAGAAFDNIGLNIREGQICNTYDGRLYLYDPATKKATALMKEFNPNSIRAVWNQFDNQIYILTEDRDYQNLYVCNPSNGKMKKIEAGEDVILNFSLAEKAPVLYYYGQSVSNANRLYSYNTKTNKRLLINDLSAERLKDIKLGEAHDWSFTSTDGSTIDGRYYLPPNFDPAKKYPMIVYYYGGTSPTNRMLEMRYSMHMYAALGYVVYTLNPSGTTGYGQEFAARHVNAWGKVTADEIIQGTQEFCKEHSFVNSKKIGCIGASYGGFMTQYLQTRTDIFAVAVSHAGISALSSYWGEGYWGWGYCSVANTNSYPWNNPELFVKQSPLYNADKINTPLLLLHGNADTNVPVGESIQMFLALKLLGKTVEFVEVDGENHGIVGYNKRIGWQNSIFAWFAKWLKDEPQWWDNMFPPEPGEKK